MLSLRVRQALPIYWRFVRSVGERRSCAVGSTHWARFSERRALLRGLTKFSYLVSDIHIMVFLSYL